MAFPFAFICFVDLLLGCLSWPFDYAKAFNYSELIIGKSAVAAVPIN
jgi:hypothetical protein